MSAWLPRSARAFDRDVLAPPTLGRGPGRRGAPRPGRARRRARLTGRRAAVGVGDQARERAGRCWSRSTAASLASTTRPGRRVDRCATCSPTRPGSRSMTRPSSRAPARTRIYSNTGFDEAAAVVERAAGRRSAELVRSGAAPARDVRRVAPGKPVRGAARDAARPRGARVRAARAAAPAGVGGRAGVAVAFPGLRGVLPGFGVQDPLDWGLGLEIRDDKSPHWTGTGNSPRTYGHFGGSGTFVWVDPDAGLALVALTDRTFGRVGGRRVARVLGRGARGGALGRLGRGDPLPAPAAGSPLTGPTIAGVPSRRRTAGLRRARCRRPMPRPQPGVEGEVTGDRLEARARILVRPAARSIRLPGSDRPVARDAFPLAHARAVRARTCRSDIGPGHVVDGRMRRLEDPQRAPYRRSPRRRRSRTRAWTGSTRGGRSPRPIPDPPGGRERARRGGGCHARQRHAARTRWHSPEIDRCESWTRNPRDRSSASSSGRASSSPTSHAAWQAEQ